MEMTEQQAAEPVAEGAYWQSGPLAGPLSGPLSEPGRGARQVAEPVTTPPYGPSPSLEPVAVIPDYDDAEPPGGAPAGAAADLGWYSGAQPASPLDAVKLRLASLTARQKAAAAAGLVVLAVLALALALSGGDALPSLDIGPPSPER